MIAESALLIRTMRRIRARLLLVRLAEALSIAACGIACALLLPGISGLGAGLPGKALPASAAAAMLLGVLLAVRGFPTGKEVARLADAKLGLQQRLETAWECLEPREDIDVLLLRDAGSRIEHIAPADVVPIRFSRGAGIALGSGMVIMAGLAIIHLLAGWNGGLSGASGNPAVVLDQAALQESVPPGRARTRGASGGAAVRAAAPRDSASPQEPGRAPDPGGSAGRGAVQQQGAGGEAPEARGIAQNEASQAPGASRAKAAFNTPLPVRPHAPSDSSREGKPLPQPEAGDAAAGGTRSGRGGSASKGMPQPLSGKPRLSEADAALLARFNRESGAYRAAEEAALSKEEIPPGLKTYISAYFAAIHR
jgi:hypothetical protein